MGGVFFLLKRSEKRATGAREMLQTPNETNTMDVETMSALYTSMTDEELSNTLTRYF